MAKSQDITASRQGAGELAVSGAPAERLLRKLALVVPVALLFVYLAGWVAALQDYDGLEHIVRWTDFKSTLTGALVISEGNGPYLYDLPTQHAAQNRILAPYIEPIPMESILPYNHIPFEALLIAPLMSLPYSATFLLWTVLMALAVGLSLKVMQTVLPIPRLVLPVMVLAAISYQPLFRSFALGQNSPLVLGLCGTYAALRSGREGWAGTALLLVALKPQILPVVVLFLLLLRHWKTLAIFAGLMLALCVAAMPVLGVEWPVEYARLLLGVANWQDTGAIDPSIMHNWRGFATNLVGGVAPELITPIFALLALASVDLLVWARLYSFQNRADLAWALAGIIAVLTSLHLNPHDLTLLIFPAWIAGAYATSGIWSKSVSSRWLCILWAGYALIPLTFYLTGPELPGLAVVPNLLLMSGAALLLARHIVTFERLNNSHAPTLPINP